MAQRDDGLDKLEAFIGAARETRAVLEREAGATADLEDEIEELGERFDHEMKDLGTTARELDARYGPIYEEWWASTQASMYTTLIGSPGYGLGLWLGRTVGGSHRDSFIAAADALEFAYENFPAARRQAVEALERAEAAATDAFAELLDAAHTLGSEVTPLTEASEAHLGGLLAQVEAHFEARS